jgi:hypothetical protein
MNISDFEKSKIFQENTLFEIAFHNALINAFDASRSRASLLPLMFGFHQMLMDLFD